MAGSIAELPTSRHVSDVERVPGAGPGPVPGWAGSPRPESSGLVSIVVLSTLRFGGRVGKEGKTQRSSGH